MCEYSELRISGAGPIMRAMQAQEIKSLVEAGHYKPDPSRVAAAMLQRRGVRELLTAGGGRAGQIRQRAATPRHAA
jgi:Anti-sigma-28 factor, FlgM